MIRIAIIGSSGGNLYNLGGKEPLNLLEKIKAQLKSAYMEISSIQFIGATSSMDNINDLSKGRLFLWDFDEKVIVEQEIKFLEELNSEAIVVDKLIARKIRNDEISGLISISSDPKGVNKYSIEAAIEKDIPIVGIGSTSMEIVSSKRKNVITINSTMVTTNKTRAIAIVETLSKYFKTKDTTVVDTSNSLEKSYMFYSTNKIGYKDSY